ncbi:MAG: diiron oxygenase, partial [Candidatus Saccharimonadales bacterium]
ALLAGAVAAAVVAPEILWTGVLAGEEPIDHAQKEILRRHKDAHPLLDRIMQIHVAEEARHISFAHLDLTRRVPDLNTPRKAVLAIGYPIIMRVLGDAIMQPSARELEQMGVPKAVAHEIWWDSPESQAFRRDLFTDARMLARELGILGNDSRIGRAGQELWRTMGIDGRPSRFRGEPAIPARTRESLSIRSGLHTASKVGSAALRVVGVGHVPAHDRVAA